MEEERPRTLNDCLKVWENEEDRKEYLDYNCGYNVTDPVGVEECANYFKADYDSYKLEWLSIHAEVDYTKNYYCVKEGLIRMFNDGWLRSPANVDWKQLFSIRYIDPGHLDLFLLRINEPQTCVDILNHLIKNVAYLNYRMLVPQWKIWLDAYKEEIKSREKELAKQAAEQKKKSKHEKPELALTVDDIIGYVQNVNSDGAHSIHAMLIWAATHKDGWYSTSLIKKIDTISKKTDVYVENNGTLNQNVNSDVSIHQ